MKSICNWVLLSNFGKNSIVKRTYIFMIILPIIVSLLKQFELNSIIDSIPFSWQILFYSALFFTIGNILYQVFAPSIIKENNSFADFQQDVKNWQHLRTYAAGLKVDFDDEGYNKKYLEFKTMIGAESDSEVPENDFINTIDLKLKKKYKFLFDLHKSYIRTFPPSAYYFGFDTTPELEFQKNKHYGEELKINSEYNLSIAFWKLFELANHYNKLAIILSFLFFLIGLLGVAIVMINSVWTVLSLGTFSFLIS